MNRRPTDSGEPPDGPDPDSTLERLLERNRFRTPPPEWREAILSMAEAPANDEAVMATPSPEVAAREPNGIVRPWARPSPETGRGWQRWISGWTVLAAAWGLVLCLQQYATPRQRGTATPRPPWSERALAELREQRSLMAEHGELGNRPLGNERNRRNEHDRNPANDRPRASAPVPGRRSTV